MYEVLLAIDDRTDRATAQARAIENLPGESSDVHVTVVHSFTDNPSGASITQLQSVRRVREVFDEVDIEHTLVDRSGRPASEILAVADEVDADLLCLGGRKRSPAGKALFGSVTQSVLLDTDRSVMVCPSSDAEA